MKSSLLRFRKTAHEAFDIWELYWRIDIMKKSNNPGWTKEDLIDKYNIG
jgi:hypothetical protein